MPVIVCGSEPAGAVVSVNTSGLVALRVGERTVRTGIFKRPRPGPVRVTSLGLEGDAQGDRRVHGGPDKAVYVLAAEDVAHWSAHLNRPDLGPGALGENLTVVGLPTDGVRPGDRLGVGEGVELEVTGPRLPCSTLAAAVGRREIVDAFLETGRCGFYCRVLRGGQVCAGDGVVRTRRGSGPTVVELVLARGRRG